MKYIKDYPIICKNCEESDREYKAKPELDKWFCCYSKRKRKINPNDVGCSFFTLDADLFLFVRKISI